MPSTITILLLAALAILTTLMTSTTAASPPPCPCGYTINATTSEHSASFTEILESDFLHTSNLSTAAVWLPQAYNVTPSASRGPYGKLSQPENILLNPIANPYDWSGEGVNGGDPGLQLWVRHTLVALPSSATSSTTGEMVPMSEIVTARSDLLYGTFRIGMKRTAVAGTCGAFFFYLDDEREIDLEFLSSSNNNNTTTTTTTNAVNLILQSPLSAQQGYVSPSSSDFDLQPLAFAPQEGYHEYRFDWLPGRVDFYADGTLLRTMRENVPSQAGRVHVSHWSNGDKGWSGGPPGEDAVMVVSYVKGYFNSSSADGGVGECEEGGRVCQLPDQKVAPEPSGSEGNVTGRTEFFGNQSVISGTGGAAEKGGGSVLHLGDVVFYGVFGLAVSLYFGVF